MEAVTLWSCWSVVCQIVADFDWYGSRNCFHAMNATAAIVADFDWYGSRNCVSWV